MELHGFKKTIKLKDMPAEMKTYPNGDRMFKREYVKKKATFAYYEKTKTGYKFEKVCYRTRDADRYNFVKNQPGFVKGGKPKPVKPKATKKAPVKATKKAPKKTDEPVSEPISINRSTTEAALMARIDQLGKELSKLKANIDLAE